jgi:hypothetical protein
MSHPSLWFSRGRQRAPAKTTSPHPGRCPASRRVACPASLRQKPLRLHHSRRQTGPPRRCSGCLSRGAYLPSRICLLWYASHRGHRSQSQQFQPLAEIIYMGSVTIWVPNPRRVFVLAARVGCNTLAPRKGTIPRPAARGSFTVRPLKCPNAHTCPDCDSVVPSPFTGILRGGLDRNPVAYNVRNTQLTGSNLVGL